MLPKTSNVAHVYLTLTLLNTLATSFIWGINTLFLLDAGLSNVQAFGANAFYTLGHVIFEVPTGIVADTLGRRVSYLIGTVTLSAATFFYLMAWYFHSPFWVWALTSMLLGLGYTFFSGATEAWLVDGLSFTKSKTSLEAVMAKGQIVSGIAMLLGSVAGGVIAQITGVGIPYLLRTLILLLNFIVAFFLMHDLGFAPQRSSQVLEDMKSTLKISVKYGFGKPAIRWLLVAGACSTGVSFYAFYAMQPYLLQLYGNPNAYSIAGLVAAIMAGAQILGGFTMPHIRKFFKQRTSLLITTGMLSVGLLALLGFTTSFWLAIVVIVGWGLLFAATLPVRQAYLNDLIPSAQRATVLSFDSLVTSSGGVVIQPVLGKVADVWSYPTSYVIGAGFQLLAIPFILASRNQKSSADRVKIIQ